jgi:hypothetical protein
LIEPFLAPQLPSFLLPVLLKFLHSALGAGHAPQRGAVNVFQAFRAGLVIVAGILLRKLENLPVLVDRNQLARAVFILRGAFFGLSAGGFLRGRRCPFLFQPLPFPPVQSFGVGIGHAGQNEASILKRVGKFGPGLREAVGEADFAGCPSKGPR